MVDTDNQYCSIALIYNMHRPIFYSVDQSEEQRYSLQMTRFCVLLCSIKI